MGVSTRSRWIIGIAMAMAAACSDDSSGPQSLLDAGSAEGGALCEETLRLAGKCPTLDGYGIFEGTGATQSPAAGVHPYDVIAQLFADDALKHRFIKLPAGTHAVYSDGEPWELPVGAIVVKTFSYPRDARDPSQGQRLIETRLLIRAATEIVPITYIWNDAQTAARREVAGRDVHVEWTDDQGAARATEYRIPTTNDCKRCHGEKVVNLLGVRTRQLDRAMSTGENQIDALAARGFFATPPPVTGRDHLVDPYDPAASIDARGRSYLDANCGHCHNKSAAADWSGLELDWGDRTAGSLGVCRSPSSAGDTGGRRFDVVPGHPERSVLLYRMQLTDSAYRMPEGSRTPDAAGIDVISRWIGALPIDDCTSTAR
jgi:uncharacterized repeat protein (TIGR03806 family)